MSADTSTASCSSGAKLETIISFSKGVFSLMPVNSRGEVSSVLTFEAKNVQVFQDGDNLRIRFLTGSSWTIVELENEEMVRRVFGFVTKMMFGRTIRFPVPQKESSNQSEPRSVASVFGEMEKALQASESKKATKPTPKDVLAMLREAAEEDMVASLNDTSFFDALKDADRALDNEPGPNAQAEKGVQKSQPTENSSYDLTEDEMNELASYRTRLANGGALSFIEEKRYNILRAKARCWPGSGSNPMDSSTRHQTEEFATQQAKWLAEYDSKNYICHFGKGEY